MERNPLKNPLRIAASFQCQQALKNLQIVASGGVLTPSQARETAQTIDTYRQTFIEVTDSSDEQLTALSEALTDCSEVLFGYGFGDSDE